MCVYSSIVDNVTDDWQKKVEKAQQPTAPNYAWPFGLYYPAQQLTQEEVNALRELLKAAKKFDEVAKQPDCELEGKKETLRKLAKQLGVEIDLP